MTVGIDVMISFCVLRTSKHCRKVIVNVSGCISYLSHLSSSSAEITFASCKTFNGTAAFGSWHGSISFAKSIYKRFSSPRSSFAGDVTNPPHNDISV